jgi:hypothetical protein
MIVKEENSYLNEKESVSIGNKILYDMCSKIPLNDCVNCLLAKIWLIGRSYAASPERRNYSKNYLDNKITDKTGKKLKPNLNTGSNGTDTFFLTLAKTIIGDVEYNNLCDKINKIKNDLFSFNFEMDKELLEESTEIVLLFNKILRRCIEKYDQPELVKYEKNTGKNSSDRGLRFFISFCSKFIHFHLPNLVFIVDTYSFAHAKKRESKKHDSDYIYFNFSTNKTFYIKQEKFNFSIIDKLSKEFSDNKEKNYMEHISRCYTIMCKLKEEYECDITPRMLDNFIMRVNKNSATTEIE